jgi:hypothetical protein
MQMYRPGALLFAALLGLSTTSSNSQGVPQPNEYWATCAAAMTQKALIVEELQKQDASGLYPAIGHYYRLACAFSTPTSTSAAYERGRAAQMEAFQVAVSQCKVDSRCIAKFVERLDGQLLVCAGEQKRQAYLIASVTRVVNEACNVDVRP